MPVSNWNNPTVGPYSGIGARSDNPTIWSLSSSGTMTSLSNHRYDDYPRYRSGGPWYLRKTDISAVAPKVKVTNAAGTSILWYGEACTRHFGDNPTPPPTVSDGSMDAMGASGMSRVLPTNPNAEILNSLAELFRDGVPKLAGVSSWEERTNAARAAGSEYLNYEFGWKPLVSDIQKVAGSVKDSHAILKRFQDDSDRVLRRRYDYPATTSTVVQSGSGYGYPSDSSLMWTGQTVVRRTTERWFEGAFMYHIPGGAEYISGIQEYISKADKLYGVSPTPEVVWNATPWSWAVDWFSNTGDVIKNLSNLGKDGLALHYGYMMSQEVVEQRTDASTVQNGRMYGSTLVTRTTVKQRRTANPYGFGLSGLATTVNQKAVVAAIAATRGGGRHG